MSDFDTAMKTLEGMRSRFDSGFSSSDRNFIESLYSFLLGKKVRRSSCGDCYRDAYIEIYSHLKRLGRMPKKSNYVLKAGIVVHPTGTNKFYANSNIPDEVAEERLAKFPSTINEYATYPADYLVRVEARKNGKAVDDVDIDTLRSSYKALKEEHEKTLEELSQAKAKLEIAAGADDGSASIEIEKLKADIAALQEENANLKAELDHQKGSDSVGEVEEQTATEAETDDGQSSKPGRKGRKASTAE